MDEPVGLRKNRRIEQHHEMRRYADEMKAGNPYGPIPICPEDKSKEAGEHQQVDQEDAELSIAAVQRGESCCDERRDRADHQDRSAETFRRLAPAPDGDAGCEQAREVDDPEQEIEIHSRTVWKSRPRVNIGG